MKSPFAIKNSANETPRYTTFDWTHGNNLTFGIGKITPSFVDLVPSGVSMKWRARTGLQFMPMVFPNQTRMYCRQSFFKVPLRTLWTDYVDFVGNFREGLEEPYHDFNGQIPSTGSLYDYLGLPTTFSGFFGSQVASLAGSSIIDDMESSYYETTLKSSDISSTDGVTSQLLAEYLSSYSQHLFPTNKKMSTASPSNICGVYRADNFSAAGVTSRFLVGVTGNQSHVSYKYLVLSAFAPDSAQRNNIFAVPASSVVNHVVDGATKVFIQFDLPKEVDLSSIGTLCLWAVPRSSVPSGDVSSVYQTLSDRSSVGLFSQLTSSKGYSVYTGDDVRALTKNTSPYYDSTSTGKNKQLKVSAYAARAYEAVYNAYFRDNRNRPLYIDGQVEYNKWIPKNTGGADTYKYKLHFANWEKDAFTTAVQSPQQGIAPLVGITTYADSEALDDGTLRTTSRVALVDEDGRKFGLSFESNEDGLLDVKYTELDVNQPVNKPRSLIDLANSGISINDFRNVNCYQKFLELNMRQGYSYRDIIQGRFNVKVRYDELMIPEFLGGFSELVDMNAITQTVQRADTGSYADQLGAMAGNAGVRRDSKTVSCFCDEESIVIGLIYVVPVPIYTQILPKHFLYRGLLDHFQTEFANIGFQPITYRELCPVQAYNESPDALYETFGYQRPWYEYVQKLDTAHGLFRTSLRNFIMNRTFDSKPELSDSFLLVDENQVNDVFAVTDVSDKIFGQIYFDMSAKVPLGRSWRPSLG
jgi:hypothetical protein